MTTVTVVGAGISGLACARALRAAGVPVRVIDRGRRVGGRMATRVIDGRPVDIGAAYLTAPGDDGFAALTAGWVERGLARAWTDTFATATASGIIGTSTGPMRFAAPAGLRSLVEDLADGMPVESGRAVARVAPGRVDGDAAGEVVLAMPAPQAVRLVDASHPIAPAVAEREFEPVIAVVLAWSQRQWPADLHGVFVDGDPDVSFIADDGDRRGDGAGVLVVHTTPERARRHLDDPDVAIAPALAATTRILGIARDPATVFAHRWTFARPAAGATAPFLRADGIAVCGDAWGERTAVRTAWASGDALGRVIAAGEPAGEPASAG
ncbi:NAD(P)/FAD-dependent oxidoreductase [Microbacterium aureliae]